MLTVSYIIHICFFMQTIAIVSELILDKIDFMCLICQAQIVIVTFIFYFHSDSKLWKTRCNRVTGNLGEQGCSSLPEFQRDNEEPEPQRHNWTPSNRVGNRKNGI